MHEESLDIPELRGKRQLRINEASQFLGLKRSRIYELIAAGELRSTKIGGARRISVAAVDEFLAKFDGSGEITE